MSIWVDDETILLPVIYPCHEPEMSAAVKEAGANPYVNSPPAGS